jgi:hypothetical protein
MDGFLAGSLSLVRVGMRKMEICPPRALELAPVLLGELAGV